MSHIDPELLSAYLDHELNSAELAQADGHLVSCSECAELLDSMKFATSAVRGLEEPVMPELHRKQLFKEINRARRAPANKWRALVAVGGTAASVVAFAGLMMIGGGAGPNVAAGEAEIQRDGSSWTAEDLNSLLAPALIEAAPQAATGKGSTDAEGRPAAAASSDIAEPAEDSMAQYSEVNHGARIAHCESSIKPGGQAGAIAVRYIIAEYEGTPAYILLYDVPRKKPTGKQLFVVAQADCSILEMLKSK